MYAHEILLCYRHYCGCTGLICYSLPSRAEEDIELFLLEDGPSLNVLGNEWKPHGLLL